MALPHISALPASSETTWITRDTLQMQRVQLRARRSFASGHSLWPAPPGRPPPRLLQSLPQTVPRPWLLRCLPSPGYHHTLSLPCMRPAYVNLRRVWVFHGIWWFNLSVISNVYICSCSHPEHFRKKSSPTYRIASLRTIYRTTGNFPLRAKRLGNARVDWGVCRPELTTETAEKAGEGGGNYNPWPIHGIGMFTYMNGWFSFFYLR